MNRHSFTSAFTPAPELCPPGWSGWEVLYFSPEDSPSDPLTQRAGMGVRGWYKGELYGLPGSLTEDVEPSSAKFLAIRDALVKEIIQLLAHQNDLPSIS